VQTGIGWGHLRQRYFLRPVPASGEAPIELTRSKPTIAWSCGGGATLPVTTRLSIGADVRVLQLLDEEAGAERFITPAGALTTVRIGVRAGWGF
jgi:hypothetical protein